LLTNNYIFLVKLSLFCVSTPCTSITIIKVLWIRNILQELFNFNKPIKIYTDNIASKTNIKKDEINTILKYIHIKFFFNKNSINESKITLDYIESKEMLADNILTKHKNSKNIVNFVNKVFINENLFEREVLKYVNI